MVHDISSATDYRRLAQHTNGLFFTPQEFSDPDAEAAAHFEALAAACHKPTGPTSVEVMMGRHLPVPAACEPKLLPSRLQSSLGSGVAGSDCLIMSTCIPSGELLFS